jgi:hypothetical protein
VLDKFNISALEKAEEVVSNVGASDLRWLSEKIQLEKVVEIIDHRKIHEADKFLNAKAKIELVGSAATLGQLLRFLFYLGHKSQFKQVLSSVIALF